jgi:AraC-like DNA-binding protein
MNTDALVSFRSGDSWSRTRTLALHGGVRLAIAECQFAPSFSFAVDQPPTEIELVISKGATMTARSDDGDDFQRGGNTLQLSRNKRPLHLRVRPTDETSMHCVSVSLSERRLRELLGATELPGVFRAVTASHDPHPLVSLPTTGGLHRLLDEISNPEVGGASRLLWYEAKTLELIALMTDALVETPRPIGASRSEQARDSLRLERTRARLVANLEAPPTLAELARTAGINETKLKTEFRAVFGTSVFAYLRRERMDHARRLLLERRFNVTQIAYRVGYTNPSKFAAAFRRQFGVSPSSLCAR